MKTNPRHIVIDCSKFTIYGAYLLCLCMLCGCSSIQFATQEQWQWDAQSGYAVSSGNPTPLHIGSDGQNMQNCSAEPLHLISATNSDNTTTMPYIQHVIKDLPFRVDSILCVLGENIIVFEQRSVVALAPDYEIQADSVVMLLTGEVYRPSAHQRADVIWRNIFVNRHEKRVLCLDRFYKNRRHICVLYILQSRTRTLRRYHAADWCGLFSWDVTDPRNMMLTATCLEGMKYNSLEILNYPNIH